MTTNMSMLTPQRFMLKNKILIPVRTCFARQIIWLMAIFLLSACEKTVVNVDLHGVNYSAEPFTYSVTNPANPQGSSGGGELIDPYAAGGTTCCAQLPKKWRPGIKLKVDTTHWLKEKPDGTLPEVKETHIVDVPPYVDNRAGDLWVLRNADGSIGVVSSIYQPDNPKWPGKIKGWPMPSLEYQRERWELTKNLQKDKVETAASLLKSLKQDPQGQAKEAWEYAKEHDPKSIKGFSGPEDPKYFAYLQADYQEWLKRSEKRLSEILKEQP